MKKMVKLFGKILAYPFLSVWVILSILTRESREPELHALVRRAKKSAIQLYVGENKDLDVQDSAMRRTALHLAAIDGQKEITELLVDAGASVELKDKEGLTPLYLAAIQKNFDIIEILSSHLQPTDLLGGILSNTQKIVEDYLTNDGDPNRNFGGLGSALYLASERGFVDIVRLLLDSGADVNKSHTAKSPLHAAVVNGHRQVVDLLLLNKANVNSHDGHCSPLHHAVSQGDTEVVESLLNHSANHGARSGFPFGNTPLHEAVILGNTEAVQLLLQYGADPLLKNWLGRKTPIDLAQGDMKLIFTE